MYHSILMHVDLVYFIFLTTLVLDKNSYRVGYRVYAGLVVVGGTV